MMPFANWRADRERAQQKRKALQMLALSGVVRPSDVELRYTVPLLKVEASAQSTDTRPCADSKALPRRRPMPTAGRSHGNQFLQWLRHELTSPR